MGIKSQLRVFFITGGLICFSLSLFAQDWKLHKDSDGIAIYTRKAVGQDIKDVKINTTINTTLNQLVAALEDFELQDSWVRNTNESKKIEELSPSHFYFYVATDFPFPASDRDAVMEYVRTQNPETKVVDIAYEALPDMLPVDPDYVRMPALIASYTLTPVSPDAVAVEYYIRADIGGKIPNWIINMAISVGPRDTMLALKKILASGQYAGSQIDGLVDPY